MNPAKFVREVRQETNKVSWPTRRETMVSTIMVLVMVVISSLFFIFADWIFSSLVQWFLAL